MLGLGGERPVVSGTRDRPPNSVPEARSHPGPDPQPSPARPSQEVAKGHQSQRLPWPLQKSEAAGPETEGRPRQARKWFL